MEKEVQGDIHHRLSSLVMLDEGLSPTNTIVTDNSKDSSILSADISFLPIQTNKFCGRSNSQPIDLFVFLTKIFAFVLPSGYMHADLKKVKSDNANEIGNRRITSLG